MFSTRVKRRVRAAFPTSMSRKIAALITAMLVLNPLVPASAATLGGVHAHTIAAGTAMVQTAGKVTLEWNRSAPPEQAMLLDTLTLSSAGSAPLTQGSTVEVTVLLRSGVECVAESRVAHHGHVDLVFDRCAALLADVVNIAFVVTGMGGGRSEGPLHITGTLYAFSVSEVFEATVNAAQASSAAEASEANIADLSEVEPTDTQPSVPEPLVTEHTLTESATDDDFNITHP